MKITINQLKHIIKEELQTTLSEKQYDIIQPGEPGYNEVYQKAYDQMEQAEALVRSAQKIFLDIDDQGGGITGVLEYTLNRASREAVESILYGFKSYNEG